MANENNSASNVVLDDPFMDLHFDKMTQLFWLIYNSKETFYGEFSNPKFITENKQTVKYLVKSLNNQLNANEIITIIQQHWYHLAGDAKNENNNDKFKCFNKNRKAHTDKVVQAAWDKKWNQHIENASTPPPPSAATNLEILKMFHISSEENAKLKEENKHLQQRLNQYEPTNLYSMSIDELKALSLSFSKKIDKIDIIIQQIYDRKIKCIVCIDSNKNIVIQDCGHFVLCANCESKLPKKICPQCQRSYTNTFKIN